MRDLGAQHRLSLWVNPQELLWPQSGIPAKLKRQFKAITYAGRFRLTSGKWYLGRKRTGNWRSLENGVLRKRPSQKTAFSEKIHLREGRVLQLFFTAVPRERHENRKWRV